MEENKKPTSFFVGLFLIILVLALGVVFFVYSPQYERPPNVAMAPAAQSNESAAAERRRFPEASSSPGDLARPMAKAPVSKELRDRYTEQKIRESERSGSTALAQPPASPFPVPATRENILRTDRALEELTSGNIAFTAPNSIQLEDTGQVQLLLGLSQSIEELKKALEQQGVVEGAKIKVSDHMEAVLSGAGFEIIPITPGRQPVSEKEPTEWRWEVKAREPGRRRLHLALNAVLSPEPNGGTRLLRTFDKDIDVTVTMRQHIGGFITAHEFGSTFVAGLLVVALGWISARLFEHTVGRHRKKRKRQTRKGAQQKEKTNLDSDVGSK